jgi:two-component sensor histidine kinase/integral membrane sensor domain MASE1
MTVTHTRNGTAGITAAMALFTLAYVISAWFMMMLPGRDGIAIAYWPPAGIALAAMLLMGTRAWWVAFIGGTVIALRDIPLTSALLAGGASTVGALSACWILRKTGFEFAPCRTRDILLLSLASLAGTIPGAVGGAIAYAISETLPWHQLPQEIFRWWTGDSLGVITLTPFVVAWARDQGDDGSRRPRYSRLLATLVFSGSLATSVAVFMPRLIGIEMHDVEEFMILPFIMFGALYLSFRSATAMLLSATLIAIVGSLQDTAHFDHASHPQNMLAAYLFLTTLICLLLYAKAHELSSAIIRTEQEKERRIAREVTFREALVKEIHHRIKNNLQGITGILRQFAVNHPGLAGPIEDAVNQVKSIAIIHGLQSQGPRVTVELGEVIRALASGIESLSNKIIAVDIPPAWEHCSISEKEAVPLALILNELISNATKHAASFRHIKISLRDGSQPQSARIAIHNEGKLPDDFSFENQVGTSTGLHLVASLLPRSGASVMWEQREGVVTTLFDLAPPVISSNHATASIHAHA